jgi:hypothetical protein
MGNRILTSAEAYAARKMGSKLTRALADLAEARIAAAALGQDVLRDLGVGTIFPLLTDFEPRLAALRDAVRLRVPAALGAVKWEAASEEKRLGDPGAVLGKLGGSDV